MREATAKGPAIDLTEFERRLRGPQPSNPRAHDPLKELARLLNGNEAAAPADPYRDVFAEEAPHQESSPYRAEPHMRAPQSPAYYQEENDLHADLRGSLDGAASHQRYHEADYQEAAYHAQTGEWPVDESQAYLDYGAQDDGEYASAYEEPRSGRRFPKFRPWHAVAGIAVLGVVSIGWTFAHRSGGSIAPQDLATIAAPEGPAKVPPAASEAPQPEQAATVLDRNENAAVRKVVTSEEQPVDPAVAPKALRLGAGPVDAPHQASSDGLVPAPEPRKVKTVSVRPDGSLIANDAVPPAVVAKPARPAPPPAKVSEQAEVEGGTPKIAAKPATTPRAAKPAPKPAKVATAEPPAAEDNAAPEAAAPTRAGAGSAGGSFAVQFGAAGSEAEARDMMNKVAGKYGSQLGGHRLGYHHAKVGDKTVYRVRVSGMNKEFAVAICEKVKASGGNCFVATN